MLAASEVTKQDVLNFLSERQYTVDIERIQKGCIVKFPQRVLGPPCPKTIEYKIGTQKGQNQVRINKDGLKENCGVPIYTSRIFIFFDVVDRCMRMGYNPDYIRFFDAGKLLGTLDDITFNEFLKEGFGEDVRKKEEALWSLFTHAVNNGFPEEDLLQAENLALEEGYLVLYECFHSE